MASLLSAVCLLPSAARAQGIELYTRDGAADTLRMSFGTGASPSVYFQNLGGLGIGTTAPGSMLDLNGAFTARGMAAPPLAPAGQGRMYFDSAAGRFLVSSSGGAYSNLLSEATGFVQGGNSFGTLATLGTNDGFDLAFETSGIERMRIDTLGDVNVSAGNLRLGGVTRIDSNGQVRPQNSFGAPFSSIGAGALYFDTGNNSLYARDGGDALWLRVLTSDTSGVFNPAQLYATTDFRMPNSFSDPMTALGAGALFFNTGSNSLRVRDGGNFTWLGVLTSDTAGLYNPAQMYVSTDFRMPNSGTDPFSALGAGALFFNTGSNALRVRDSGNFTWLGVLTSDTSGRYNPAQMYVSTDFRMPNAGSDPMSALGGGALYFNTGSNALRVRDSFNSTWLGVLTSDTSGLYNPTQMYVSNDFRMPNAFSDPMSALGAGALFFNTGGNALRVRDSGNFTWLGVLTSDTTGLYSPGQLYATSDLRVPFLGAPPVSALGGGALYYDSPQDALYVRNAANSSWMRLITDASGFVQNGNSFGTLATLGTNDANALVFETAGTGRMLIDTLGRVGIGTSAPAARLHVTGQLRADASGQVPGVLVRQDDDDSLPVGLFVSRERSSAMAPGAGFGTEAAFLLEGFTDANYATAAGVAAAWETAQVNDTTSRDAYLAFLTMADNARAERMRITSAGLVGIGTTAPAWPLEIYRSGSPVILGLRRGLSGDWMAVEYTPEGALGPANVRWDAGVPGSANDFRIWSNDGVSDAFRLTVLNTGQVGIGTTAPGALLDVNGQIAIRGGSPAANRVLTSDAAGLATWSTVSASGIAPDSLNFSEFADGLSLDAPTTVSLGAGNLTFDLFGTNDFVIQDNGTTFFMADDTGAVSIGSLSPTPLYVSSGGNVGIRTTSPAARLDIATTGGENLLLGGTPNVSKASGQALTLGVFGTSVIAIMPSGNVGVGDMGPLNRLDVDGAVAIGTGYAGNNTAPANGLIVQGNVGIGTPSPGASTELSVKAAGSNSANFRLESGSGTAFTVDANDGTSVVLGAFSNVPLSLITNAASRMSIDTSGNVGIGTTVPNSKFHIRGTGGFVAGMRIEETSGTTTTLDISAESTGVIFNRQSTTVPFLWRMAGAERMRLTDAGDIGLGTSAPLVAFHLARGGGTPAEMVLETVSATERSSYLMGRARGSIGAPSAVLANDQLGALSFTGYGATGYGGGGADIVATAAENWTDAAKGTFLRFDTTPMGGSSTAERMRIDPDGNVAIGTTSAGNRLDVYASAADASGLRFTRLTSASPAGGAGTKVLSVNASGDVVLVADSGAVGGDWNLSGNSGTSAAVNYLGTADLVDLVVRTNAIERMRILSGGNVGIGIAAPDSLLHVKNAADNGGIVRVGANTVDTTVDKRIRFGDGDFVAVGEYAPQDDTLELKGSRVYANTTLFGIGVAAPQNRLDVEGAAVIGASYSGTNAAPANGLLVEGSVGIGTTAPSVPLSIETSSGSGPFLSVRSTLDARSSISIGSQWRTWQVGQNLPPDLPGVFDSFFIYDQTGGATRLIINTAGNVGIGTSAPGAKLDVAGQIKIAGGSPGTAKVLTSDVTGLASWSTINGGAGGSITPDSLDFTDFSDAMTVDASTEINMGFFNLMFSGTGAVTMGTNSPPMGSKLHVYADQASISLDDASQPGASLARLFQGTNGFAYLTANLRYDGTNYQRDDTALGGGEISTAGTAPFRVRYAAAGANPATLTEAMRVDDTGNVGIGSTNPQWALDVVAPTSGTVRIGQGATSPNLDIATDTGQNFRLGIGTTEMLTILTSGNVGVGSATPQTRLDVAGNVFVNVGVNNQGLRVGDVASYGRLFFSSAGGDFNMSRNVYWDGSAWTEDTDVEEDAMFRLSSTGGFEWWTAPAGAGAPVWTQRMTLTNTGALTVDPAGNVLVVDAANDRVGIGVASPQNKLDVEGAAVIGATYSGTNFAPANGLLVEGNVGIGTTSPGKTLEVFSSGVVPDIRLKRGTGSETWDLGGDSTVYFHIKSGASRRLTIDSAGLVGIGTSAPAKLLHLSASTPELRLERTAATMRTYDLRVMAGGELELFDATAGFPRMVVSSAGNVGIGTSPAATLDVAGAVALRGGAFTAANGANQNIAIPNASYVRITGPTASFSIGGIAGGVNGRVVVLHNATTFNMSLVNEDIGSTTTNRIYTLGAAGTSGEGSFTLIYSATDNRWIVIGSNP